MGHPSILVVEDDHPLREALCDTLEMAGFTTSGTDNGVSALQLLGDHEFAMVVSDVQMAQMDGHALLQQIKSRYPRMPVLLMTAYGSIQKAVVAMRDGAADYLVKPFEAKLLVDTVTRTVSSAHALDSMPLAQNAAALEILAMARRVAVSDATVLITGESGTGKEVLARYIHEQSPRSHLPFVAINCAAIPDTMLEATLFGYEKGAFTGAVKTTPGKFEQAGGGTLLLDEITEMDLGLQAKLLRVLQEKEVERLGGNKLIPLQARVLATSNRNLKEAVASNAFREDLYYRLNVFPIGVLPLRQRPEDILLLAHQLLHRHADAMRRQAPVLNTAAQAKLQAYHWPGNVRELDNVVHRALILQGENIVDAADIHLETTQEAALPRSTATTSMDSLPQGVKQHEYQMILQTLQECAGNRKQTASKLGISERTLRYKMADMRRAGLELD